MRNELSSTEYHSIFTGTDPEALRRPIPWLYLAEPNPNITLVQAVQYWVWGLMILLLMPNSKTRAGWERVFWPLGGSCGSPKILAFVLKSDEGIIKLGSTHFPSTIFLVWLGMASGYRRQTSQIGFFRNEIIGLLCPNESHDQETD